MTAALWTHIGYARVAGILAGRAGLHFAPNRQPAAEVAMKRVMRDSRIAEPLGFAREVARDDEILAALIAEVTVGETYFFREPAQLDYIRRHVLPAFQGLRTPAQPLRAWSAGCATGEEPYTLGIMLRESGWANSARVLGTDISRPRLAAAGRARYTRWSLRGMAEEAIDRYFIRRGSQFLLRPEFRAMVDFRPLNLADDGWPGAGSGIGAMDLILCRNVLIYFDRATVAEVAARLLASLSDDGWLFMGASDPMLSELVECETVVTGAGLAYRRGVERQHGTRSPAAAHGDQRWPPAPTEGTAAVTAHPATAHPTAAHPPGPGPRVADDETDETDETVAADAAALADAVARYDRRDYAGAAAAATAVVGATPADEGAWALLVRALANGGQIVDAEQACVHGLERHPASTELTYLHAVLLVQRGQFAAAAAAARRVLYLDRSLAVAHLTLGAALARLGHRAQAQRAFRAAEHALEPLAAEAPVPLADGEAAHRLREAARTQRRLLGEEVA